MMKDAFKTLNQEELIQVNGSGFIIYIADAVKNIINHGENHFKK